jgi:integrase
MPRRKTRRSPGEGTYWYDEKTRQHRYRYRGKTVSDSDPDRAKEKLRKLKRDFEDGIRVEDRQTFAAFLRRYLDTVVASEVGESTAHDYGKRIGYYILPWLGDYPVKKLTLEVGQAWLNAMVAEGWSQNSIRQALRLARRALDRAVGEELLRYNPFAMLKVPRAPQPQDEDEEGQRALTQTQLDLLLADVKAHDKHHTPTTGPLGRTVRSAGMYVVYVLAALLGLRRGEILGLRRKDIDLDKGVLRVRQQVVRIGNTHKISKTLKTRASRRDLPLTAFVLSVLRPHILRSGATDDDLIFPGRDGGPLRPDAVTKHFARTTKRLALVGYTFHDLRATALTNWRTAGAPLEVVAALAGHDKPDVTAEVYIGVDMDRKRKAVEGA